MTSPSPVAAALGPRQTPASPKHSVRTQKEEDGFAAALVNVAAEGATDPPVALKSAAGTAASAGARADASAAETVEAVAGVSAASAAAVPGVRMAVGAPAKALLPALHRPRSANKAEAALPPEGHEALSESLPSPGLAEAAQRADAPGDLNPLTTLRLAVARPIPDGTPHVQAHTHDAASDLDIAQPDSVAMPTQGNTDTTGMAANGTSASPLARPGGPRAAPLETADGVSPRRPAPTVRVSPLGGPGANAPFEVADSQGRVDATAAVLGMSGRTSARARRPVSPTTVGPAIAGAAGDASASVLDVTDAGPVAREGLVSAVVRVAAANAARPAARHLEVVLNDESTGRVVLRFFGTASGTGLLIRATAPETYEILRSHMQEISAGVERHGVTLTGLESARDDRHGRGARYGRRGHGRRQPS